VDVRAARARLLPLALPLAALFAATAAAVPGAFAAAPSGRFAEPYLEGSRHYQEGRFDEAIRAWESILTEGVEAPELYYNLGNAHLKAGNLGLAIANYGRARILAPRDGDVKANLEYARSLTLDVKPPEAPGFVALAVTWVSDSLRPRQAAPIASIAWFVTFAFLALFLLDPRRAPLFGTLAAVSASLFLIVAVVLTIGVLRESTRIPAVILAPEVAVRSGPGEGYTAQFNLHEGAEVIVRRRGEGWAEIRIGPEFQGWVPESAFVQVWPPVLRSG
jgi:tetratricopeptide (TPR) repeat protein